MIPLVPFTLSLFQLQACFATVDVIDADIFEYFVLSDTVLPVANAEQIGGYDETTQLIWILGGMYCQTCLYSFDVSNDNLTEQGALINSLENNNPDNSVIIDSVIYFTHEDGPIGKFHIPSKNETYHWFSDPSDLSFPCMVTNNEKTHLFMVGGNEFWIIDIKNETLTQGPNLHFDRFSPSCSVTNDNYLYVTFGDEARIERINLDRLPDAIINGEITTSSSDVWEVLSLDLNDDTLLQTIDCADYTVFRHTRSLLIDDNIYIFGAYCYQYDDGSTIHTTGFILKFDPNEVSMTYVGTLYDENYKGLFSYVDDTIKDKDFNRVYFIGGLPELTGSPLIYYSNDFDDPTAQPTGQPSYQPSAKPTNSPSDEPTDEPTMEPTVEPTLQPTERTTTTTVSDISTTAISVIDTTVGDNVMSTEGNTFSTIQPSEGQVTATQLITTQLVGSSTADVATVSGSDTISISTTDNYITDSDATNDQLISGNNESVLQNENLWIVITVISVFVMVFCIAVVFIYCGFNKLSYQMAHLKSVVQDSDYNKRSGMNSIENEIERQPLSSTSNAPNFNINNDETLELRKVASVSNSQVVSPAVETHTELGLPVKLPPQAKPNDMFGVQSTNALEMQEFEKESEDHDVDDIYNKQDGVSPDHNYHDDVEEVNVDGLYSKREGEGNVTTPGP